MIIATCCYSLSKKKTVTACHLCIFTSMSRDEILTRDLVRSIQLRIRTDRQYLSRNMERRSIYKPWRFSVFRGCEWTSKSSWHMCELPRWYSVHSGCGNMLLHCEHGVRANFPTSPTLWLLTFASLHTLETKGMVRGACFSSDGNLIFAWTWRQTQNQNQNLWYMWDCASTIDPIMEIPTEYIPVIHLLAFIFRSN